MTLRSVATSLAAQRQPIFVRDSLPEVARTTEREAVIAQRFGLGGQLRVPPDMGEIQERLLQNLMSNNIEAISRRDLRYAPQIIWYDQHPIANQQDLLERLLHVIENAGRRSIVRTLAAVYFRQFQPSGSGMQLVGRFLSRMVKKKQDNLFQFHEDFNAFDPAEGHGRIAAYCIEQDIMPQSVLRKYGLCGEALISGFGVSVFRAGMDDIAEKLSHVASSDLVDKALSWTREPEPARYRGGNITLANTLLLPFGENDPAEDLRNLILDVLLERIGDPRTHPERWQNMEKAAEVARRWLTRVALQQFLEIVDQVAYPVHWNYRRAFWTSLYEMGAITQAWVAFGPLGAERARRNFGENLKFGRLTPSWKHIEPGHAVLVMRIGDFVAIDWSQNGRCIFWPASDPDAPRLYQETYQSGDIAPRIAPAGGIEKTHSGSQSYSWQRHIADFLRRKTGIELRDRDYHVR